MDIYHASLKFDISSKIPNLKSLGVIIKAVISKDVTIIREITDEIIKEIKRRIIVVTETMNLLGKEEKYIISKGKRYWNIKVDDYYKHSKGRVEISTGNILSPSGTKPSGNILHSWYSGTEYISVYKNKAYLSGLNSKPGSLTIKNKKTSSIFYILVRGETKKKDYTKEELELKSKDELISIYRNIKTGYGGKNKKQLIDGILGLEELEELVTYAPPSPLIFSLDERIKAKYFSGRSTSYIFAKVVGFNKSGNAIVREYKTNIITLPDSTPTNVIQEIHLIDELIGRHVIRYSKKYGNYILSNGNHYIIPKDHSFNLDETFIMDSYY